MLSLAQVIKQRVAYDSGLDNAFHVHLAGKCADKCLYYSDLGKLAQGNVLFHTVEYKTSKYSHADYLRAIEAPKLQIIMGNPSFVHFKLLLASKQLHNYPVTVAYFEAAKDIFGPSIQFLKGKTMCKKVKQHKNGIVALLI